MGTLHHLCNISVNLQLLPKKGCRVKCLNYNTVFYFIKILDISYKIVAVPSQSCVWLFATPWTAGHQASLSFTISQSLLKFMSVELVMLSHQLICRPLLLLPSIFSSIRVIFNESALWSGGQSSGASASVLPVNIQDWSPLGWTGWISLQSKGLSRVFSNTLQRHQFFSTQPSSWSNS